MEIKDVNLNIKLKSNKVTRILHLLITDAIADFQKSHPKSIPSLLSSLKKGDSERALEKIDQLLDTISELNNSIIDIKKHISDSMPPVTEHGNNGGKAFVDPDGKVIYKMQEKGDSITLGGPGGSVIEASSTSGKKKTPAKKRATKKKAKKEEE